MHNPHQPRSQKQILVLVIISIIVLAGAGVLGGFVAGALSASVNRQSRTPLSTTPNIPLTPTPPQATEETPPMPSPTRPTSTPIVAASPTQNPASAMQPTPTFTESSVISPVTPTLPSQSFFEGPIMVTRSIQGRPIQAYRFGTGSSVRAVIGAIHGGYEWNTATLLTRTMELLQDNPQWVPPNVCLYVIPNMNPDGYSVGTDAVFARMNANLVDLNRNWDYQWQMTATHGTRPVKAGSHPFSEPETRGIRDFILNNNIEAVIFYHSALGVVFHGANTEASLTYSLTKLLSDATGYPIQSSIPGQITTGDAIDYLSEIGVAGTEIELTTHAEVSEEEFQRNINGLKAFLQWFPESTVADSSTSPVYNTGWITHVIQSGDMLSSLALQYDTTIEQLMYINGLTEDDVLYVGEEILVPEPDG
jgi:LysM repeat protein